MRYVSHRPQVEQQVRRQVVQAVERAGRAGEAETRARTPVETGYAARSVHLVVVDEAGQRIAGDRDDGNGNPTPDYPATGRITAYLGSNTAYRDRRRGRGYYKWLEIGARGRPGRHMLARGYDVAVAALRRAMSDLGRGGRRP